MNLEYYVIFLQNFLYKCVGVAMRKSTKKDFVNKMLDLIFSTVKHTDQLEREVLKFLNHVQTNLLLNPSELFARI